MSLPKRSFFKGGIEQSRWTPRAVQVLATAKDLATPRARIGPSDILLALECGDHQVSRLLKRLGIAPSATLKKAAPCSWSSNTELYYEDFDGSLTDFPRLVIEEAAVLGDAHFGIEHLLLYLARIGVPGVDLPYERIKNGWLGLMGKRKS